MSKLLISGATLLFAFMFGGQSLASQTHFVAPNAVHSVAPNAVPAATVTTPIRYVGPTAVPTSNTIVAPNNVNTNINNVNAVTIITLADSGKTFNFQVGQKFILDLGPNYSDVRIINQNNWNAQNIIAYTPNITAYANTTSYTGKMFQTMNAGSVNINAASDNVIKTGLSVAPNAVPMKVFAVKINVWAPTK